MLALNQSDAKSGEANAEARHSRLMLSYCKLDHRLEERQTVPRYTAAQLRNAWKPVMSRLGFRIDHSCFVKRHGPIKHSVCFDRCRSSRDVLVKLFVTVFDPFESDQAIKERVCFHAYLHRDGAHFKSTRWDEEELAGKSPIFEAFGELFFEQFRSVRSLIAVIEAAQAEFKMPESYLRGPVPEPADPIAREFLSSLPTRRQGPIPLNEELLALLYWHSGDIHRAVEHVRRYLELIPEDERMQTRLTSMTRPVM